jgi:hypothetical protein
VLVAWARVLGMEEEQSDRILTLAGHNRLEESTLQESQARYDPSPWPRRREHLLDQARELLRLAETSPPRDELADLLRAVFDLVKFRLTRDEEA